MEQIVKFLVLAGCVSLTSAALVSTSFADGRLGDIRARAAANIGITRPGDGLKAGFPAPIPKPVVIPNPSAMPKPASATAFAAPHAPQTQAQTRAWTLYKTYCFACHGATKEGLSASVIKGAITAVPSMRNLSGLNFGILGAIAAGQ